MAGCEAFGGKRRTLKMSMLGVGMDTITNSDATLALSAAARRVNLSCMVAVVFER